MSMPTKLAMNKAAAASYNAVPSILTVAPKGSTKFETGLGKLKLVLATPNVTGSVAALELVAKAVIKALLPPCHS